MNMRFSNPGVTKIMKRRRRKQMKNSGVKVNQTARKVFKAAKSKAKVDCHGDDMRKDFKQDICERLNNKYELYS